MLLALLNRPRLPVDETRHAALDWEMWFHGDCSVTHLNGEPNCHKPPVLSWVVQTGLSLFSVPSGKYIFFLSGDDMHGHGTRNGPRYLPDIP